jgi:hypothetical protein
MNEQTRNEIVSRYEQGQSMRSIARTMNISPRTSPFRRSEFLAVTPESAKLAGSLRRDDRAVAGPLPERLCCMLHPIGTFGEDVWESPSLG